MNDTKPILLIEDDTVDAMMVERALRELKITNQLVHKFNGEEALEYLQDESNKMPCIILLDLNMPRMNGIEFLKTAKENEALKKIPVVALTSSKENRDKLDSFKFGVGGYMVKTPDYKELVEIIRTIDLYWTLSESGTQKKQMELESAKLETDITC